MRSYMLPLVGLAITLALPAAAQQMKCDGPQDGCKQIAEIGNKYREARLNGDVAAMVALYTSDGVVVPEGPIVHGKDAIEKWYRDNDFKLKLSGFDPAIDQAQIQGKMGWALGSWSAITAGSSNAGQTIHGNWEAVYSSEEGPWKIRVLTFSVIETPPGQAGAGQTRARTD
jgi:ketosteroid isomerase-like protein